VFSLDFTSDEPHPTPAVEGTFAQALMVMDDHEEHTLVPIDYWSMDDYRRQWREGAERIVSGLRLSCLITQMPAPLTPDPMMAWTLYRLDEITIAIREEGFYEVDPQDPYASLVEYGYDAANGETTSEWRLTVADFAAFVEHAG
jgi:hypothetical protein